ncbi:hypothetical protein GCM10017783_04380 [Deinococcus piscis]|uniref:Uncharacterized protein n=1 Tax=Deinococcus piscis TaxID=394230 RepID=A0ABQ3JZB2_9DEIO|nr:hypothetical protein [Deinococcus piscis]GHF95603.1 hypothetical protein GCM10017783_04380 [Deinococcus piscis]
MVAGLLLLELYLLPWLAGWLRSCEKLRHLSAALLLVGGLPPLLSQRVPDRQTFHPVLTPFLLGSSLLLLLTSMMFC